MTEDLTPTELDVPDDADAPVSDGADPPALEPELLSERAARELGALESVLRKTRRRMRAPLLVEGFAWTVATAGAVLVTAQFVGLLAGEHGPAVLRWLLAIGLGATAFGAVVALIQYVRMQPSLDDVARRLQREVAGFRSDLVAALEFGRALTSDGLRDSGWSPTLAYAHLRRTTRAALGSVDGRGTLGGLIEPRALTPTLVAIGGCLVLLVAPMVLAGPQLNKLWNAAVFEPIAEANKGPAHRPVVGDIDLKFSFPPYTGMQRRMEPFTTGHIATLVGTEVTIRTYPLIRADKFELVMKNADGERVVPLKPHEGRLEASLLLTKAGSYSFRATQPDGQIVEDGIERPIVLTPDQAPTVTITSHGGEIEVSPDEVLELRYTVSDDYGIESVARATTFGSDDPKRITFELPELNTTPAAIEQSFELDLREFSLQAKDVLTVWVEATDNNSLTGPGVGKATPLILRVASPEDRHQKIIAEEMEVLEALLGVLADFLEQPVGAREPDKRGFYRQLVAGDITPPQSTKHHTAISAIHQNQTVVLTAMGGVVERMKNDPLMTTRDVTLFESLYEQLYSLNRDGAETLNQLASDARSGTITRGELQKLADWVAKDEDALEKGLIRLDNLLATQKMDSARRSAEQIRELKDRLKELLEKYRDTKDPALKEAILREIQRLRQRMSELMQRMSNQLEKLPQEHVNMEALRQAQLESDAKKMGDSLQQLEDLLEKGDIDGALKALDEMTSSLDEMTAEMGEQFDNAEPEGMREMDKALSELMDKTNDLEARQRELERQTRDAQDEQARAEQEQLRKMLEERTREIQRMVREQQEQLQRIADGDLSKHDKAATDQAVKSVQQLDELLQNQDIEQALEQAKRSREDLRSLQFSLNLAKQYQDDNSKRGAAVNDAIDELDGARPRARRIESALEEIMDQAKSSRKSGNSPAMQQLAKEQRQVQQQAEKLQQDVDSASERFPMLEQKLSPPLGKAREQMGQAGDALDTKKAQQSLDHQRGALESLRELKQSMRDALQKQKQQGQQDGRGRRKQDKVTIPTKDGRSQQDFREDVMDGMKQERLQDYNSEIQRYYEALMQ